MGKATWASAAVPPDYRAASLPRLLNSSSTPTLNILLNRCSRTHFLKRNPAQNLKHKLSLVYTVCFNSLVEVFFSRQWYEVKTHYKTNKTYNYSQPGVPLLLVKLWFTYSELEYIHLPFFLPPDHYILEKNTWLFLLYCSTQSTIGKSGNISL